MRGKSALPSTTAEALHRGSDGMCQLQTLPLRSCLDEPAKPKLSSALVVELLRHQHSAREGLYSGASGARYAAISLRTSVDRLPSIEAFSRMVTETAIASLCDRR